MFSYFGYGSNINLTSLRAKGVVPHASRKAILRGYKLVFNVQHWFRHEGGVGNIVPSNNPDDRVEGLVHDCDDEHLELLDAVESYGVGYDRIEVPLETSQGPTQALTYVGIPSYLNNDCLPTRRYLNIILKGATAAGLNEAYIEKLRSHKMHPDTEYPLFEPPSSMKAVFTSETLAQHRYYTALAGAVFDMRGAESRLECLVDLIGGKDMTLFFLKRHDTSDGRETLDDYLQGNISEGGKKYINAYLHEYNREYAYIGQYHYR
ncbi:gamma-glutamylcyclotransferase family protein [Magnetococcus sp. PR-3]|uniref:gamma-glutamylcyclotransferase family protein n=1 Tax=Magnetococcus sp. PR-3 TaxID=3120355 RepID=UPI002FCE5977